MRIFMIFWLIFDFILHVLTLNEFAYFNFEWMNDWMDETWVKMNEWVHERMNENKDYKQSCWTASWQKRNVS